MTEVSASDNVAFRQLSYDASLNPFADDGRHMAMERSPCLSGGPSTENLLQSSYDTRKVYKYNVPARFHSPPPSLALLTSSRSMFYGSRLLQV